MRRLLAFILTWQAKRYLVEFAPKVIVIAGSVGKTSTTQAVATILEEQFKVRKTIANYNTDLGVPCSIFQEELPSSLRNPILWARLFMRNEQSLRNSESRAKVLVLELGSDHPGELAQFDWLRPTIGIVTAVSPEHMEQFKTIDAVAREELSISAYCNKLLCNKRMIDSKFVKYISKTTQVAVYDRDELESYGVHRKDLLVIGEHSVDAIVAGLRVGKHLGMTKAQLRNAASRVRPQKGRMQLLRGIKNATIIDDTYNSSPEAVIAALTYVYSQKAHQRIALLGNMNELGIVSAEEHKNIGNYCDASKLDLVITLGEDANKFTAPAAREAGCNVVEVTTPYEAAERIKKSLKNDALILCKGSQNGVFAEETVKQLLANTTDEKYLVRQSPFWLKVKGKAFI